MFKICENPDPKNILELAPKASVIPEEFKTRSTIWNRLSKEWFFSGLKDLKMTPNPGVDPQKAMKHIKVLMQAENIAYEHREISVAYLLSLWFNNPKWERN